VLSRNKDYETIKVDLVVRPSLNADADTSEQHQEQQQQQQQQQLQQLVEPELDAGRRRQLEDELRDPKNFLE
jgi:hypothetical protein